MKTRKNGFTLVELLVVIVIIGLLASMLLPSLKDARDKGLQARCMSNLKQLGLASTLYADDYDGWLPPFYDGWSQWVDHVYPYLNVKEPFYCPSDMNLTVDTWSYYFGVNIHCSYGYNSPTYSYPPVVCWKVERSPYPSETCLFIDTRGRESSYLNGFRHSGGANVIFRDLHVKWLRENEVPQPPASYYTQPFWSRYNYDQ